MFVVTSSLAFCSARSGSTLALTLLAPLLALCGRIHVVAFSIGHHKVVFFKNRKSRLHEFLQAALGIRDI